MTRVEQPTTRALAHHPSVDEGGVELKQWMKVFAASAMLATSLAWAQTCEAFGESPVLAERVAAGDLPPAAERLPANPVVLQGADGIGTYGGMMFDLYDGSRLAEFRQFGYENLVRWTPDGSQVVPNIAESWDVSEDGTAYTFTLREGLRWSDGHPFTSEDIAFFWTEVETNPLINPGGAYSYFYVAGELATLEVHDDLSFTFSWSQPNGLFLQNLSTSYGVRVTQFPAHYLSQFSNNLNPDGVAQMMAEAGQTDYRLWWKGRVGTYGDQAEYNDPDRPSMQPWIPTAPYVGEGQFTFVRNPYYFKVDAACNQLPYVDARTWTLATDPEVRVLKTLAGEDHFSRRDVSQPPNKGVLFDGQDQGNYRFIGVENSDFNQMLLRIKFTHPDPVRAELFLNVDFRRGLSAAMDRQNVIDTVYVGQGLPHQMEPRPGTPFYDEERATQYTDHDPELANELLDRVLPNKDAQGFRLLSNGERFTFNVLVNRGFRADWVDVMQLIERDWEAVGIDVNVIVGEDEFSRTAQQQDDVDAWVWAGENGTGQLPLLAADEWVPESAVGWYAWADVNYNNREPTNPVVTPPADVQRMIEIVSLIPKQAKYDDQAALMNELLDLAADGLWTIGLALPMGDYRVVNADLRNVPDPVIGGWLYPGPGPANFETFYYDTSN